MLIIWLDLIHSICRNDFSCDNRIGFNRDKRSAFS